MINFPVQIWLASQLMGDLTRCKSRFCPFAYATRRKRNCPAGNLALSHVHWE